MAMIEETRERPDRYVAVAPLSKRRWPGPYEVRLHIDGWDISVCTRPNIALAIERADRLLGRFGTNPDFLIVEDE